MFLVFERFLAENYFHVSLFSTVSKIFEMFVNNRPADHLENVVFLCDSQYGFRYLDLLTVAADRITISFNTSVATGAIALKYERL